MRRHKHLSWWCEVIVAVQQPFYSAFYKEIGLIPAEYPANAFNMSVSF